MHDEPLPCLWFLCHGRARKKADKAAKALISHTGVESSSTDSGATNRPAPKDKASAVPLLSLHILERVAGTLQPRYDCLSEDKNELQLKTMVQGTVVFRTQQLWAGPEAPH